VLYYLRYGFTPRPLDLFQSSQVYPWFTKKPLEREKGKQLGLWPWRGGGSPEFGGSGGGVGRERGREVCELTLGRFAAGVGTEGQPATVLRGVVRRQPRERLPRRGVGTVVATGGRVSFSRC
jgi:hypothetical protein